MRPLSQLLSLIVALGFLGGCPANESPEDAASDAGPPAETGPAGDGSSTDGRPADSRASCTPPDPPLENAVDPCLLAHDPQNPHHLSAPRPASTAAVTVRLETQAGDVERVVLRAWTGLAREYPMSLEGSAAGVDTYAVTLPPSAKPIYYRFTLEDGSATRHLTAAGPGSTPPTGADDFVIAPAASGKTVHAVTTFSKPELWLASGGSYSKIPMTAEGPGRFGASGLGDHGAEARFHLRETQGSGEDRPPGGGDYLLRREVDEAWLEKGVLFDVPLELVPTGLIDCHTHPYNKSGANFVYDAQPLLTLLPAQGFTHALTMAGGDLAAQQATLGALHAAHRWLVPLVWVNPLVHTAAAVEPLIANHGFRGLKFHPTGDNFPADSTLMDPFLALAAKHRLPVQIHSATDENARPWRIVALAQRHPEVAVIMIHTELGAIDKTAALDLIKGTSNVYAETSWTNPQSVLQAMQQLDSSRTLLGTDATVDGSEMFTKKSIANPQGQYVYTVPQVIAAVKAQAHPDAFANWARLTAIRLYGLRFRPDSDLYDTDGDGMPDVSDPDVDNDGQPDAADPAPLDPGSP